MKNLIVILFALIAFSSFAQNNPLIIQLKINLPNDSILKMQLINSINGFLSQKEKPNKENTFVLKEDLLETSVLLDEIKEIEKSNKYKDNNFFKGYLTNISQLNENKFSVQFSYIGIKDSLSILRASFKILVKKKDNQFYCYSPLKENTVLWKNLKMGSMTFYFKDTTQIKKLKEYGSVAEMYDKKLNAPNHPTNFYFCDNVLEALQIIGVEYKMDYNGDKNTELISREENKYLVVKGSLESYFSIFDPHDLWHDRLRNVISSEIINRPVDEGYAYLYAGSWGLSWKEILNTFNEKVSIDPKSDWIASYENYGAFQTVGQWNLVSSIINSLIIQKIEKEKGFSAVMELLTCGKTEKGNENYFKTLEKITGINKNNFNEKVWALIKESKN